jgi:hypothetical protein
MESLCEDLSDGATVVSDDPAKVVGQLEKQRSQLMRFAREERRLQKQLTRDELLIRDLHRAWALEAQPDRLLLTPKRCGPRRESSRRGRRASLKLRSPSRAPSRERPTLGTGGSLPVCAPTPGDCAAPRGLISYFCLCARDGW